MRNPVPRRWARVVGTVGVAALLTLAAAACSDSRDAGLSGDSGSQSSSSTPKTYGPGDSIKVSDGSTFVIALDANPTTGYSWSAQTNANVELVSSKQVAGGSMPGAPGTQRLTFRATSAGTSTLVLDYSRPFEQGVPPVDTESFPVTVTS